MAPYSEDDEIATQSMAVICREQPWIVQITALDRRMMSTERLLSLMRHGDIVSHKTLVWRGGMENWAPIERLDALTSASPPALTHSHGGAFAHVPPERAVPLDGVLLSCLAACLAVLVTSLWLASGGVFEPSRRNPSSLSAGLSPAPRSVSSLHP